jgi:tetratricopeptide (TPR) repeat protein
MTGSINIFCSYAQDDKEFQDELMRYINKNHIDKWYEREIESYNDAEKQVDAHLNIAHIILLLFSVDFVGSDYSYGAEMQYALERHEAGEAIVIPIIVRPSLWEGNAFSTLSVLPTNRMPITCWSDTNQAFQDVALGIRRAMNKVLVRQYIDSAADNMKNAQYQSALAIYEQAILLAPDQAQAWRARGQTLIRLNRFDEALDAYEQAIRLEPNDPYVYKEQGDVFYHLTQWHEALIAYKTATRLKPNFGSAYLCQGRIHIILAQLEEERLQQLYLEQSLKKSSNSEDFFVEE